jgi:glutamine synthetase
MANASGVTQRLTDGDIEFVDLCFTDPRGKMQHVTMETKEMGEDAFAEGVMFDGSSIAGCKAINESDMTLTVREEAGSHAIYVSKPQPVADIIEAAAG